MIDDERRRGQNEPLAVLGGAKSRSGAVSAWFVSFCMWVTFYIQLRSLAKCVVGQAEGG